MAKHQDKNVNPGLFKVTIKFIDELDTSNPIENTIINILTPNGYGKSTSDLLMFLVIVDYPNIVYSNKNALYAGGYRYGDTIGLRLTSTDNNNAMFKSIDLTKLILNGESNAVYKVLGDSIDQRDYLLALIPTTYKPVNITFTQTVSLIDLIGKKAKNRKVADLIPNGSYSYSMDMTDFVTKPTEVPSAGFSVTDITVCDADNKDYSVTISWTYDYDNDNADIWNRVLSFNIYCTSSIIGSVLPMIVPYNRSGVYSVKYTIPFSLKAHMINKYKKSNEYTEDIFFEIFVVKSGLINSDVTKTSCRVNYIRPINITDIWIQGDRENATQYRTDMTYTALNSNGTKVWDDTGDSFAELHIGWTVSEEPARMSIKAHTYFSHITAKADILRLGTETDVTTEIVPSGNNTYYYSYPTYLDRTIFERNGSITEANNYDDSDISHNTTRWVAFEVTVWDEEGVSASRTSPIVKIERRPIIRNYQIHDEETGGSKYYNYEYGFNFNLFPAAEGTDLDDVMLSWGVDRVTLGEWLGLDLEKDNKSFSELVQMYTQNFFRNVLTTYERFRNIVSPVWFEMYLVIKSDNYFKIDEDNQKLILMTPNDLNYKNRNGGSGLIFDKFSAHEPEYEYLIDAYDKDFADWILSADHQHKVNIDKDDFAFFENSANLNKIKTIIDASIIKYNNEKYKGSNTDNPTDFNIYDYNILDMVTPIELVKMFRRLVDEGYLTFRLQQYEYLPSIYLQKYPVHWECPVCGYKFVTAQKDTTGTLYLFEGGETSSYYKKNSISQAKDVVPNKFNTVRSGRKGFKCPKCNYVPNDYEIDIVPQWMRQLFNAPDIGLPILIGKKNFGEYGYKYNFDLYDYNNRLDKLIMGLFYAGKNTAEDSFKNFYLIMAYIFSGEFSGGDPIQEMLKTSANTGATDSVNTSGITNFKQLFNTTGSYISEFRDYYKATCSKCGHELYLDVLVCNNEKIICPYCLHNNINDAISDVIFDGEHLKPLDILKGSTSTVSDTDFLNFYHKMGALDLDIMAHYCPDGSINITSVNTNASTPQKLVTEDNISEIIDEPCKVTWVYNKSHGKLTGFNVCVGMSSDSTDWKTIVVNTAYGASERLVYPKSPYNELYPDGITRYCMIIPGVNGHYDDGNDRWTATVTNSSDTVTCELEFTINSLFGDDLTFPFKIAIEVRPYYTIVRNYTEQTLYGKSRKYLKHDASNWDGMYTDYGIVEYTSAYANVIGAKFLKYNPPPIIPDPPPPPVEPVPAPIPPSPPDPTIARGNIDTIYPVLESSNIYNVTPRLDELLSDGEISYAGEYQWMGKRNPLLLYELFLDEDTSSIYRITDITLLSEDDDPDTDNPTLVGKELSDNSVADYDYEYAVITKVDYNTVEHFSEGIPYNIGDIVGYDETVYRCVFDSSEPAQYTEEEILSSDVWTDELNKLLQLNNFNDLSDLSYEYYEETADTVKIPDKIYFYWDEQNQSYFRFTGNSFVQGETYYEYKYINDVSPYLFVQDDYELTKDTVYDDNKTYYLYDSINDEYVEYDHSVDPWEPERIYEFITGNVYAKSINKEMYDRFPVSDVNNIIKVSDEYQVVNISYLDLDESLEYIKSNDTVYNPKKSYYTYDEEHNWYNYYDGGAENFDPENVTYYEMRLEKILVEDCSAGDSFVINLSYGEFTTYKTIEKVLGSRDFSNNFGRYVLTKDATPISNKTYYTFNEQNQEYDYHSSIQSFEPNTYYYEYVYSIYDIWKEYGMFLPYLSVIKFDGNSFEPDIKYFEDFEMEAEDMVYSGYLLTSDDTPVSGKNYYTLSKTVEELSEIYENVEDRNFGASEGLWSWNYNIVLSSDAVFSAGVDYYEYVQSSDSVYHSNKVYYIIQNNEYVRYTGGESDWQTVVGNCYEFVITNDTAPITGKDYYKVSIDVLMYMAEEGMELIISYVKTEGYMFRVTMDKDTGIVAENPDEIITDISDYKFVTTAPNYEIENINQFVNGWLSATNLTFETLGNSSNSDSFSPSITYRFFSNDNSFSRTFNVTSENLFMYDATDILNVENSIKWLLVSVFDLNDDSRVFSHIYIITPDTVKQNYKIYYTYDSFTDEYVKFDGDEFVEGETYYEEINYIKYDGITGKFLYKSAYNGNNYPININDKIIKNLCDLFELIFLVSRDSIYELNTSAFDSNETYYIYNNVSKSYEIVTVVGGFEPGVDYYIKPYDYSYEISILTNELSDIISKLPNANAVGSMSEYLKYILNTQYGIPVNSNFMVDKFSELEYVEYSPENSYEYCWTAMKTVYNKYNEIDFEISEKPMPQLCFVRNQKFDFCIKHIDYNLFSIYPDFSYNMLSMIHNDDINEISFDEIEKVVNQKYYMNYGNNSGNYHILKLVDTTSTAVPENKKFYFKVVDGEYVFDNCLHRTSDMDYVIGKSYYIIIGSTQIYDDYTGGAEHFDPNVIYERYFDEDTVYYEINENFIQNANIINSDINWTQYTKDINHSDSAYYFIGDLVKLSDYYVTADMSPVSGKSYYTYDTETEEYTEFSDVSFEPNVCYYLLKSGISSDLYEKTFKYYSIEDLSDTDYWVEVVESYITPDAYGKYNILSDAKTRIFIKFNEEGSNTSSMNRIDDLDLRVKFEYTFNYLMNEFVLSADTQYNPSKSYYYLEDDMYYLYQGGASGWQPNTYYEYVISPKSVNVTPPKLLSSIYTDYEYVSNTNPEYDDTKVYYIFNEETGKWEKYTGGEEEWDAEHYEQYYELVIVEAERDNLISLEFCDRRDQSAETDKTIFADTDVVTKYCPKCGRVYRIYTNNGIKDYYYIHEYKSTQLPEDSGIITEDEDYTNPVIYDKYDMVSRETLGYYGATSESTQESLKTFDGRNCVECGSVQVDLASWHLDNNGRYSYIIYLSKSPTLYKIDSESLVIYTDDGSDYYYDEENFVFVSTRYYVTEDTIPLAGKTYYIINDNTQQYEIANVENGFVEGTSYYENDYISILSTKDTFLTRTPFTIRFSKDTEFYKNVRFKYKYHNIPLQNISNSSKMVESIGDDEGSYWTVRRAEIFNGFYNVHIPTYTEIGRSKYITPEKYKLLIDSSAGVVNIINNYFDDTDPKVKKLYFGVPDTSTELPNTEDEIVDDNYPAKILCENLDTIIGEDTE